MTQTSILQFFPSLVRVPLTSTRTRHMAIPQPAKILPRKKRQTQTNSNSTKFHSHADVDRYCDTMGLSIRVNKRLRVDVDRGFVRGDSTSYRETKYKDRLPASHRCPATPPGFWDVEFSSSATYMTQQEQESIADGCIFNCICNDAARGGYRGRDGVYRGAPHIT